MDRRTEELLERGVKALEALAQDEMEIRVETLPPVCPHCDTMNPKVRVGESENQGPLAEFVISCQCLRCSQFFWVVPIQTECVKTSAEAQEVLDEKVRMGGYQGEDKGAQTRPDEVRAGGL